MMGSWVTDALGHGGGFAFPFSIEGCWPEAKLQPPRHSVPSPPPGASLGAMFSLCSLFLSCRVVLRVHSAIPACLRVREGLPDSPGLSASWGLAVAAFLRILSMLFPLDQDTLRELWSYSHWVSEGSLAASRAPTPQALRGSPAIANSALCCPAFPWILTPGKVQGEESPTFISSQPPAWSSRNCNSGASHTKPSVIADTLHLSSVWLPVPKTNKCLQCPKQCKCKIITTVLQVAAQGSPWRTSKLFSVISLSLTTLSFSWVPAVTKGSF